ncbi:MAG: IS110 family transposase [Polyangiaceae bacterium]
MRIAGIDIGSEKHVVAVVTAESAVLVKATPITEDREGYEKLKEVLGDAADLLVVMEATGHYWQNLFFWLSDQGFAIALINPLRSHRFAEEDLLRAKTDAVDALQLARFGAEKKPTATRLPDEFTIELRELVTMRDRCVQDLGDKTRQLHRLVDLCFPELTRHIRDLGSHLATTVLGRWPTAEQLAKQSVRKVSGVVYDGRREIGTALAEALVAEAKKSVGRHKGPTYRAQATFLCEDIAVLRSRLKHLDKDMSERLGQHEVGMLLTTIDGVGEATAARLIAALGDPSDFRSPEALAAYVGLVPRVSHSGKRTPKRGALHPVGNAKLRAKLWMPILVAVRKNAWLKAFYDRLIAKGKPPKVALTAAMRKLLTAVYSVAKNRKPFVPRLPAETTTAS